MTLLGKQEDGHSVPVVFTMKIRCGKPGGGKGPLIQKDISATLSCNNDQYLFAPQTPERKEAGSGGCYSIDEKMGNTYVWEEQANTLGARDFKQPQAVLVKRNERE